MIRLKKIPIVVVALATVVTSSIMVLPAEARVPGCVAVSDTVTFTDSYPIANSYAAPVAANDSIPNGVEAIGGGYTPSGGNWWVTDRGFGYTPVDGFVGTEVVSYNLRERSTKQVCSSAAITITADVPEYKRLAAADDRQSTNGITPIVVPVVKNDRFISPPRITSVVNHTPVLGSFRANSSPLRPYGSVDFSPVNAPSGVARATYYLRDSYGQESSATVSIDVTHVNQAPKAERHYFTISEDTGITGTVVTSATDPDSPSLQVSTKCQPSYGTVSMQANGTFTYRPLANVSGVRDSFCYEVNDGQYTSNNMVHIDIAAVNDAPRALFDLSKLGNRTIALDTASYNFDIDNSNAQLSLSWTLGDGRSRVTNAGSSFTHKYSKAGTYVVTLTITDPSGATSTYKRSVTVR